MSNARYTTYKEIYSRVTSVIKGREINPADVLEWTVECETEWIGDFPSPTNYYKVRLDVRDKAARTPLHCVRLLDVYWDPDNQRSHVNHYNNGAYIVLDGNYEKDYVYVNFTGLVVDPEDGVPLIKKGHEEACVQHVLVKLFYEDFLTGRLSPTVYGEMKEERNLQVRAAQTSLSDFSRRELMEISAIHMNMLPYIRYQSFAHKGIGG